MVSIDRPSWSVGVLIENEREIALNEFNNELPGTRTVEECMALHIAKIEQNVVHRPGGRVAVHTLVVGRRHGYDVQRWQQYTTLPGGVIFDANNQSVIQQ